mgnify:CR=1 FL=1
MFANVLIIDKRKELPVKYKKALESPQLSTIITTSLKDALIKIQTQEPDIIIVSDSIEENLSDFCQKIRTLTYNIRPVIIAISKSADTNDRISTLEHGADDFISEPVNIEEFKTRVKAHIRRELETSLDDKTLLPNKKLTLKTIKRMLNSNKDCAILLVGLDNLKEYQNFYTELAGDKIVQTFLAIVKSAISENDFVGQLNYNEFIIITDSYSVEKLAEFLTFAFDTVAPKFYSQKDVTRGYMLLNDDSRAGMRVNFVSLTIGGVLETNKLDTSLAGVLERLYYMKKVAKIPVGSHYAIDRVKLSGVNSIADNISNKNIYIKEPDEALYLLLRTTIELQGYNIVEELDLENPEQPFIIILDALNDFSGLELCKKLKNNVNFVNTKIFVTSTIQDKTAVLNSGADLYLPKPYEISDLIRWIEYFTNNKA